jgi:hypothetical protein
MLNERNGYPEFFAIFQNGSGAYPRPPPGKRGAGSETLFVPADGTQFLGMGPKIWQMGP